MPSSLSLGPLGSDCCTLCPVSAAGSCATVPLPTRRSWSVPATPTRDRITANDQLLWLFWEPEVPAHHRRENTFSQVLQLRTKGFDDAVRAELKKGLAQVLVLGAGYDARALRLAPEQKQAKWVEIDMPASQIAKRESLAAR